VKITFLGTGTSQGIPLIGCQCEVCTSDNPKDNRTRSSVMVQTDGLTLIIDTGTDFRFQMLREKVKQIDAILYTHPHKDHTGGMDDIRPFYFKNNKQDIPIFGSESLINSLKREFSYIFSENKYPGVPSVKVNIVCENTPFMFKHLKIIPISVWHGEQKIFGYRINDFTYITDANRIEPDQLEKIKTSKVLVLNALQNKPHHSHFTLPQAIEIAQEIGAEITYFTHISHTLGKHEVVNASLPAHIALAYDGLSREW
jgi:phosphoribosyl 1,2-cyclic phosphate phosphodiesterase